MKFDFCFSLVVQFGRSVEDLFPVQMCTELDPIASGAINKSSNFAADFTQPRNDLVVDLQVFYASFVGFQADVFPWSTGRQDWTPVPAAVAVSYGWLTCATYLQMILCFPYRESGHVAVEADPFVLRVGILDLLRFSQRRLEINLQYASCSSLELFRDVHTMVDEHVVAFEYCLAIELDCSESIKAVKRKNVPNTST